MIGNDRSAILGDHFCRWRHKVVGRSLSEVEDADYQTGGRHECHHPADGDEEWREIEIRSPDATS